MKRTALITCIDRYMGIANNAAIAPRVERKTDSSRPLD